MAIDVFSNAPPDLYTVLGDLSGEDSEHLIYLSELAFDRVFPSQNFHKQLDEQELKKKESALHALSLLYRNAMKLGLSEDRFEDQLRSNSILSGSLVKIVMDTWNKKESIRKSEALKFINIGKLVDMQWKFGVAVTSNSCKALKMPYVTMVLTVSDSSCGLVTKSFDMDIQEFRNFSKQMKDMASTFETV